MADFPVSYKDTSYDEIDKSVEAKLNLPAGLLSSIRLNGEKSNADQVSVKTKNGLGGGATTPYQIMPKTRIDALKAYKIDAKLSPENAALVAGNLLKDSLSRNNNDVSSAIAEYHGGTNRKNWGDITKAYVKRVADGLVTNAQAGESAIADSAAPKSLLDESKAFKTANQDAATPSSPDNPPNDLIEEAKAFKEQYELIKEAKAFKAQYKAPPSLLDKVGDVFTGSLRKTPESAALPEWTSMPELSEMSWASAKTGLGTVVAPANEVAKIIKHNYPDAQIRKDAKGNNIITSSIDHKDYVIPPGISAGDLPRALAGIGAFFLGGEVLAPVLGGSATTVGGMAASGAATQAGIEATQAATGGDFNTEDVVGAAAIPPIFHVIGKGLGAAGSHVMDAFKKLLPNPEPIITQVPADVAAAAARSEPLIQAAMPKAAPILEAQPHLNISAGDDATAAADDALAAQKQATYDALPQEVPAVPTLTNVELGDLAQKATSGVTGKKAATEKLASEASIDAEVQAAAKDLGFVLEPDQMTTNDQFRRLVGHTRSQVGSDAEARGIASVEASAKKADEVMVALGSNGKDISSISENVRSSLAKTRTDLETQSDVLYKQVDAAVLPETKVQLPNLKALLETTVKGLGGKSGLKPQELKLLNLTNGKVSYLRLTRERQDIGSALAGKESPYGSVGEANLKQLYGALAKDQHVAVVANGGEVLGNQFKIANQLVAKRKALEKRIINAFGKDNDGSIVPALRSSIAAGAKGSVAGLAKILKVIPPELHQEAIATSLATLASEGEKFSFNKFATLYRGLRQNTEVYKIVVSGLGKGSHETLNKLYMVANGIAKAQGALISTGKANQAFFGADNILSSVVKAAAGGGLKIAAGAAGDAMGAGGFGTGAAVMNIIMKAKTPVAKAVGDLITSPEFKAVAEEAATKQKVNPSLVKKMAHSKAFKEFLNKINHPMSISDREKWIIQSLQAANEETQ